MKKIAIIGAGISGLNLANNLKEIANVEIFEKARGVGGRMSTRYAEPFFFDHGTQYFTARAESFQNFLKPYLQNGLIKPWEGKVITIIDGEPIKKRIWFEPHYVATPNMNSLCKHLADGLNISLNTEILPLKRVGNSWQLHSKNGDNLGQYDIVISTAPPTQTNALFGGYYDQFPMKMLGCYTLMLGFNEPWNNSWIAANVQNHPAINWIAINSTKPQRDSALTCIIVNSSSSWAEANIDADVPQMQNYLLQQFEQLTGINHQNASYVTTHRWRYASTSEPSSHTKPTSSFDCEKMIGATGDWLTNSRIEDAWLNSEHLSQKIISFLHGNDLASYAI